MAIGQADTFSDRSHPAVDLPDHVSPGCVYSQPETAIEVNRLKAPGVSRPRDARDPLADNKIEPLQLVRGAKVALLDRSLTPRHIDRQTHDRGIARTLQENVALP